MLQLKARLEAGQADRHGVVRAPRSIHRALLLTTVRLDWQDQWESHSDDIVARPVAAPTRLKP
jgi:hypothetical protein